MVGAVVGSLPKVYTPLIQLLIQELGYIGGYSLRALEYDWRLSPRRLEVGLCTASSLSQILGPIVVEEELVLLLL